MVEIPAALSSVEALALTLLEDIPAAIIATDLSGQIIYANVAAETLYGWSRDELVGRKARGTLLPENAQLSTAMREQVMSGETWSGELLLQRKDKTRPIVNLRLSALTSDDGRPLGFIGVAYDISERYLAEQRLAVQYAVTSLLAGDHSFDHVAYRLLETVGPALNWQLGALWQLDDEGRYQCLSHWVQRGIAAEAFLKPAAAAAAGDDTLVSQAAATAEPVCKHLAPTSSQTEVFGREIIPVAEHLTGYAFPVVADGSIAAVLEFYSCSDTDLDAHTTALVSAVASQLGQYIEADREAQLRAQSERRKSSILQGALDCIITIDKFGRIIELNPAAEEVFGFAEADVVGKEMASLIIPERLRDLHRRALERLREGGEAQRLNQRLEFMALRADGSEIPVEITLTSLEEDGEIFYTAFLRDISERREADDERKRLLQLERFARLEAEVAQERFAFLAEVSDILSKSLDYEATLSALAELIVPRLADWCSIDLLSEQGEIERLIVVHSDPNKVAMAKELQKRYPPDPEALTGVPHVIRTGESELAPDIPDALLREALKDDPDLYEIMAGLGLTSAMIVPLVGRGKVLGAITLISDNPERHYTADDLALAEAIGERAGLAVDNVRLFSEQRAVAHRLQRTLLPDTLPRIDELEVAGSYRPGLDEIEIGGDFYDLFEVQGAYVAVIGDVCGKGIEAATLTGLARHTVRAAALLEPSPARILELLNSAIYRQSSESQFATVACVRLEKDPAGGFKATIASGGHPSPLLRTNSGDVLRVQARGMALGMFEDVTLTDEQFSLKPGETLTLYTDGVIEARANGNFYGKDRLIQLIADHGDLSAVELADLIDAEAAGFAASATRDDIAVLSMRCCESNQPAYSSLVTYGERDGAITSFRLDLQLQATLRSIAHARRSLDRIKPLVGDELYEKSKLLLSEIVSNAVKHTSTPEQATVGVSVDLTSDLLSVTVTDTGPGFTPDKRELHDDQESGWGLWLVQELADRWGVDRDDRNSVWFDLRISPEHRID